MWQLPVLESEYIRQRVLRTLSAVRAAICDIEANGPGVTGKVIGPQILQSIVILIFGPTSC